MTWKYVAKNTWGQASGSSTSYVACFVCPKSFLNGSLSRTMAELSIYIGIGNCVNSVDREAREITGAVPGIKSWLVVMERRVLLYGQNGNGMLCPFRFLSCFSNLYYEKNVWCGIIERSGNVLHIKTLCTPRPLHLRVDVNRIFSLKLSFSKLYLCSDKKLIFYCMNYMDLRIANKSERYTMDRLPWIITSRHTSAMISVNSRNYDLHIEFESSIAEKSNHEYTSTYGAYDLSQLFSNGKSSYCCWNYLPHSCWNITLLSL